jgi:hypothetical protein
MATAQDTIAIDISPTHEFSTKRPLTKPFKIDGVEYRRIVSPDVLTISQHRSLDPFIPRFQALLLAKRKLTSKECIELEAVTREICVLTTNAPPEVIDRLVDEDRLALALDFLGLLQTVLQLTRAESPIAAAQNESQSTGSKPSRDSVGSTQARRSKRG